MRHLFVVVLSMTFFTLNLFGVDATLKIEKDVEQRSRIALMDGSSEQSSKVFDILLSDLKISGHFLPDSTHHIGDLSSNYIIPALKSQEYVIKYSMDQRSSIKLLVRLLKASDGTQIFKKSYAIPKKAKMPFLIHKAISDINNILKYPSISWINRYVAYSVYTTPGRSEIRVADYTFTYKKTIIKGGLNLFPKWADSRQRSLYYTSYKGTLPTLYKLNIYNGTKTKIASSEGMLVCSDVSKNSSKLLLTMAPEGQADIYELDLTTKAKRRVTNFKGIDVNGRYVDDESRIIFISNRLGYANVFKKSIQGGATSQVVYHGRNNNACDAHGDKIVYSSRESNNAFGDNTFNLYLASTGSSDTRPITTTGANQFPRFSTDGSVILFLKQRGRSSSIGYTNLTSHQSLLFPFNDRKVQSIDW
ncbi:MAG: Tol-Pal system protein TolB [Sulfurovum sp.]|uniref:Tol-Pal system protein TolB n=1 Tax=Sulfurovum sp. TaxID=1969726 RepID=UPI002867F5DE|nr:Tol-Pal system protein TolB [Sulfurovum sp.]MCO4845405.1 Tol-Pal system protein TolB [Sulfurovum sp.]